MSWLHRWFNFPPSPNCPFITDGRGEKYWIGWEDTNCLYVSYRGKLIGKVDLVFEEHGVVTLADIRISPPSRFIPNLRKRGLGKAMLQEAIRYAKTQGAWLMHGRIQAQRDENVTQEYLVEWYQRQGFEVNGTSIYLDLRNGTVERKV
jgi:L-amino acid N-acyltransferase YncA